MKKLATQSLILLVAMTIVASTFAQSPSSATRQRRSGADNAPPATDTAKPAQDDKPADAKSPDLKSSDAKTSDTKPSDIKSAETSTSDSKAPDARTDQDKTKSAPAV